MKEFKKMMKAQMKIQNQKIVVFINIVAQLIFRSKRKIKMINISENQTFSFVDQESKKKNKSIRIVQAKRVKIHENRFDSENEKLMSTNNTKFVLINKAKAVFLSKSLNQRDSIFSLFSIFFNITSKFLFFTQTDSIDESIIFFVESTMRESVAKSTSNRKSTRRFFEIVSKKIKAIFSIQFMFKFIFFYSFDLQFFDNFFFSKSHREAHSIHRTKNSDVKCRRFFRF